MIWIERPLYLWNDQKSCYRTCVPFNNNDKATVYVWCDENWNSGASGICNPENLTENLKIP